MPVNSQGLGDETAPTHQQGFVQMQHLSIGPRSDKLSGREEIAFLLRDVREALELSPATLACKFKTVAQKETRGGHA